MSCKFGIIHGLTRRTWLSSEFLNKKKYTELEGFWTHLRTRSCTYLGTAGWAWSSGWCSYCNSRRFDDFHACYLCTTTILRADGQAELQTDRRTSLLWLCSGGSSCSRTAYTGISGITWVWASTLSGRSHCDVSWGWRGGVRHRCRIWIWHRHAALGSACWITCRIGTGWDWSWRRRGWRRRWRGRRRRWGRRSWWSRRRRHAAGRSTRGLAGHLYWRIYYRHWRWGRGRWGIHYHRGRWWWTG